MVTKDVNSAKAHWSLCCNIRFFLVFICSLVLCLCWNHSRHSRLPWAAGNQGPLCPVFLRKPRLLLPPARNGLRVMATKNEQSFPRRAAPVIPTSVAGAAPFPLSFPFPSPSPPLPLSPLLNTILSPFHLSRAMFHFAYTFEVFWASLIFHVNFRLQKVYKVNNVLISLIISFSVYGCMCSHAFLFSG